jgi:hypothetical protein
MHMMSIVLLQTQKRSSPHNATDGFHRGNQAGCRILYNTCFFFTQQAQIYICQIQGDPA